MSVLIAGGCGFIGLNIAEACLAAGEDIVLLDRNAPPAAAATAFAALPGSWQHEAADVTRADQINQLFADHDVREVYYGATITSGPERERDHPEQVIAVNLLGLTHVIGAAAPTSLPLGNLACTSAMRSVVSGWLRRYGNEPLSLNLDACCNLSNIDANPCGAKPAWAMMPKPMRSASRSMSREKLSWF